MRKTININQNWKFIKDGVPGTVDLPHTWNADCDDRCVCYYEKYLEAIPEGRVMLEFEGVNSVCDVQMNCVKLGTHRGGYSRFRYDVTEFIRHDCVLGVDVSNVDSDTVYPSVADFTFYGGIYRGVNLIVTGECRFSSADCSSDGVYVTPFRTADGWALGIKALIDSPAQGAVIRYTLRNANGRVYRKAECDINTSETYIRCGRPHLWNGRKDPYLYTLTAEIILPDGTVSDNLSIAVGFRSFEIDNEAGAIFNGSPVRLRGLCRHQDREGKGNALTEADHREDMDIILESGANALRLAHYQQAEYFYDLCDRNGLLVWAEIPVISKFSAKKQKNAKQQLCELIKQNYNHPSIFCWGIANEITMYGGKQDEIERSLRELASIAREIDTTRYTACAQLSALPVHSSLNAITDLVGCNHYFGWYNGTCEAFGKWLDAWFAFNPEKRLCISEYGADAVLKYHSENQEQGDYSEEYQCVFHEKYLAAINSHPRLWGSFVWNAFDFGSAVRNEAGVKGRNNKGLVTFDRGTKKDAFYLYKASWSDESVLHICSKRFVNRPAGETKIKVYSNLGTVTLSFDGGEITQSADTVFEFTVPVKKGENIFTASAGELSEQITVNGCESADESYTLPEELHSFVRNFDFTDTGDGSRFSLDDRLGELLDSDSVRALIRQQFGSRLDILFSPAMLPARGMKIGTALKFAERLGLPQGYAETAGNYIRSIKKK